MSRCLPLSRTSVASLSAGLRGGAAEDARGGERAGGAAGAEARAGEGPQKELAQKGAECEAYEEELAGAAAAKKAEARKAAKKAKPRRRGSAIPMRGDHAASIRARGVCCRSYSGESSILPATLDRESADV